jgi:hypothetical protein
MHIQNVFPQKNKNQCANRQKTGSDIIVDLVGRPPKRSGPDLTPEWVDVPQHVISLACIGDMRGVDAGARLCLILCGTKVGLTSRSWASKNQESQERVKIGERDGNRHLFLLSFFGIWLVMRMW